VAAWLTATGSARAALSADKMFAVVDCGGYLLLRTATLSVSCIKVTWMSYCINKVLVLSR
jgi:hypothetical protein